MSTFKTHKNKESNIVSIKNVASKTEVLPTYKLDKKAPLSPAMAKDYHKAAEKMVIDPEIQRAIMQQVVDYRVAPVEEYVKPATYVVASNGTFVVKKTPFGTITVEVKEVPYLPEMKKGFNLQLPKVPYHLFLEAYSFFKAVSDESHDEAALVLYWNTEAKAYENLCPEQIVSGAAVKFGDDKDYLLRMIDAKYVRVCELHSHNTMSAFHSGTDDNDEIFDCSFLVFGKLNTTTPEHIFSYAASGIRVDSTIWDLYEKPVSHTDLGGGVIIAQPMEVPIMVVTAYPEGWHDKLSKYSYVTAGYKGKTGIPSYDNQVLGLSDEEEDWYGYNSYGSWDSKDSVKDSVKDRRPWYEKEEDDAKLDKEVRDKLKDKTSLFDDEDDDDEEKLNLDQDPKSIIDKLEAAYGTAFVNEISDAMVEQGFGNAIWEDNIKY